MRIGRAIMPGVAASLLACGSISRGEAKRLLTERVGAGEPVELNTSTDVFSTVPYLEDLATLGLIEFTPGDLAAGRRAKVTVTAEGSRLGLALQEGETLGGHLCDIVFGSITRLGEPSGDSAAVVEVDYVLRHANDTPLMAKLRGSRAVSAGTCSADSTITQRGQFVRDRDAWRLNRPPVIPGNVTTTVHYEYDRFGIRSGATNEVKILPPTDGDGDSVSVTWVGSEFNGTELAPMAALRGSGLSANFPGMRGAVVFAIARDRWGGVDSVKFCFENSQFRC